MAKGIDVLSTLINTLLKQKYPQESLVIDWPLDKNHFVDLVVLCPETNRPIAIFEIYNSTDDKKSLKSALVRTRLISKIIKNNHVPIFSVFVHTTKKTTKSGRTTSKSDLIIYGVPAHKKHDPQKELTEITDLPRFWILRNTQKRIYIIISFFLII